MRLKSDVRGRTRLKLVDSILIVAGRSDILREAQGGECSGKGEKRLEMGEITQKESALVGWKRREGGESQHERRERKKKKHHAAGSKNFKPPPDPLILPQVSLQGCAEERVAHECKRL